MNDQETFEKAYQKLETILEKLHSDQVNIDDSLKLYEQADQLIAFCEKKLVDAENKIEVLIKNRAGELNVNKEGSAETTAFTPN